MFERFTERARRSVVLARAEARGLDHDLIATEHLLLGLLRVGDGVAAQALVTLGLDASGARRQVEQLVGRGSGAPTAPIPVTPRAKKLLELALREALQLTHTYIGTEHILLGIIRERDGVAAEVLTRSGLDLGSVRATVLQVLGRAEVASEPRQAPITEPARCSRCGTPSPDCGALFVRSGGGTVGSLICEQCLSAERGDAPH